MTEQAAIQRDGDSWALSWDSHAVAMGMERLLETRDGLRAEITVESRIDGRVLGPVWLNLLSSESQTRFANACAKRVNGLKPEMWHALVVQACAIVAKQYREPSPVLDLSEVDTAGGIEYLTNHVPLGETTVLYGDGESAKSLIAVRIAAAVALGKELPWGERPTRVCKVLYLDWETNPKTVALRLKRITLGMNSPVPKISYRQCFRTLDDELPHIREEVSKQKIGLVVIDSIGFAAYGSLTEDETARRTMNNLRMLSPATRLVVAHVSAEAARQTSGKVSPFGSRFFWNGMRSGIEIRRSEEAHGGDSMELGLYHQKANDGEHQKPLAINVMFDGRAGPIAMWESDVNDTPDLAARTSLSSRLRVILRKGSADLDSLAEQLDVPQDTISKTLRRMPDAMKTINGTRNSPSVWGLSAEAEA